MTQVVRQSYGIACCRRSGNRGAYKLLLVHRRVSYQFQDMVLGRFQPRDTSRIKFLLRGMTPIEREELLAGNFKMLWWRATRGMSTETEIYAKRWQKFVVTFGGEGPDGARYPGRHDLGDLLAQTPCRTSVWEIPKGRRKTSSESPINCAVREFREETGISKNMYRLLFGPPIVYSYTEGDVLYEIKYFPAIMTSSAMAHIRPQVHEVIGAEWMDIRTIDAVAGKRMGRLARRILGGNRP